MNKLKTIRYHVLVMIRAGGVTKYYRKDPLDIDALYKMHKDMYPKADFIICEETVKITVDCQGHAIETHFMEV